MPATLTEIANKTNVSIGLVSRIFKKDPTLRIRPEFGGDERLTGALLDRLTHHVHVVEVFTKSWRLNASLAEIGKKLVE